MEILLLSGRINQIHVSFRHVLQREKNIGAYTEAIIEWWPSIGPPVKTTAIAKVHPNDLPEKKIGRKIALARALLMAGFDKRERTQIWKYLLEKGMRV